MNLMGNIFFPSFCPLLCCFSLVVDQSLMKKKYEGKKEKEKSNGFWIIIFFLLQLLEFAHQTVSSLGALCDRHMTVKEID